MLISFLGFQKMNDFINNLFQTENWVPSARSLICSQHFESKFLICHKNYVALSPAAIPTIAVDRNMDEVPQAGPSKKVDDTDSSSTISDSEENLPTIIEDEIEHKFMQP